MGSTLAHSATTSPAYVRAGNPDFDIASELRAAIDCDGQLEESGDEGSPTAEQKATLSTAHAAEPEDPSLPSRPTSRPDQKRRKAKKEQGHAHRKKRRLENKEDPLQEPGALPSSRPSVATRYHDQGPKIVCDLDTKEAKAASTGYVGLKDPEKSQRVYTLAEVTGEGSELGFELQEWDGIAPLLVVDKHDRVIAVLAGRPDDVDWDLVHQEAAKALESKRSDYVAGVSKSNVRRVDCPAVACGVSMGGGQTQPMNLRTNKNTSLVQELNEMDCFKRIAGFGSAVMKHRAPRLYAYYAKNTRNLHANNPGLQRPFECSVFCAATYNLGPRTVCHKHKDFGNLPFGWCAVTALGSFDYELGGHLILWECRLVIQFPPGSTVLLPSAIISHSNVAISCEERRYSFVQYTSGSLFRWVDNNHQTLLKHLSSLTVEELEDHERANSERWSMGLSLLPLVHANKL